MVSENEDFKGLSITVIILASIHIIVSAAFASICCKKKMKKSCIGWIVSLLLCIAILVLSATTVGNKEKYSENEVLYMLELLNKSKKGNYKTEFGELLDEEDAQELPA